MHLNWLLMFEAATRRRHATVHPLDDPLERAEWKGQGWAIAVIAWLVRLL